MLILKYKYYIFFFINLIFFINCSNVNLIDIDEPVLNFYSYQKNDILFQFNEPVKSVNFFIKNNQNFKELKFNNIFPVSNIYIPYSFFDTDKSVEFLDIEAIDANGNKLTTSIAAPVVNADPAIIKFKEILIKYSKKKSQKISLETTKSGNTSGFSLVIFNNKNNIKIPFASEKIETGKTLELAIDSIDDINNEHCELSFKLSKTNLILKNKLSQTASLILILNNKDEVIDYFLYYDSRKHTIEYYNADKKFIEYKNELKIRNIKPQAFDIKESTSIKTIKRINNSYIISK